MEWLAQRERESFRAPKANIQPHVFLQSFSVFDALWIVLAVATAFRIAAAGDSQRPQTREGEPAHGL